MSSKQSFSPIVNADTRLLILGSLPGDKSLAQGQYYANKQNAFWYLMSQVLNTDLVLLGYEERLTTLLGHGVGLWDVIADAIRDGSLDSKIKNHRGNDLVSFLEAHPRIAAVAFNGQTAAKLGRKLLATVPHRVKIVDLPSSSPAYTLALAIKRDAWLQLQAHSQNSIVGQVKS